MASMCSHPQCNNVVIKPAVFPSLASIVRVGPSRLVEMSQEHLSALPHHRNRLHPMMIT